MAQPNPQIANDPQLAQLRVPPHSIEAEQSVLGALLIDLDAVIAQMSPRAAAA